MRSAAIVLVLWVVARLGQAQTPCGVNGRVCIDGQAQCVAGKCQCINPPYVTGDGEFACYRRNQRFTELRNDPTLVNYDGEHVDFPYPCRFLWSEVETQLKDSNKNVIGTCHFLAHAFNAKIDGKFFTEGVDGAIRIMFFNGTIFEQTFRFHGIAMNDVFNYHVFGKNQAFLPDGTSDSDSLDYHGGANGVRLAQTLHLPNNQLIYNAERGCGIRVTFVAYDVVKKRSQPQVPGASIAINCAHHPVFLSGDIAMATGHHDFRGGSPFPIFPGLTLAQSQLLKALLNPIAQSQPYFNAECAEATNLIQGCNVTQRIQAIKICNWLLGAPRFIRCIDSSIPATEIFKVFNACVGFFCDGRSCSEAIDLINNSPGNCASVSGIPDLAVFLSRSHCPGNPIPD